MIGPSGDRLIEEQQKSRPAMPGGFFG